MMNIKTSGPSGSRLRAAAAALLLSTALGATGVQADSIKVMDYLTEGTATVAFDNILMKTCSEKTGLTVERNAVPYAELVQQFLLAASTNAMPDIAYIDNSDVAQLAAAGFLTPIADAGISLEGFVPALQALGNYEGKDYAVPSLNNTVALYYHKALLEAAGLQPPTTWAELKDGAKKLTQGDTYGFVFPGINNEQGTFHTSPFIWSNGGNFETLNSAENVEALTYLRGLVEDGSVSKSVVTFAIPDARDQFVSGRAAMMVGGSWLLPQLDEHPDLDYGVVPVPVPEGKTRGVPTGGELWVISATANKANAKAFLECVSAPDLMLTYALDRNNVPSREALWADFNAKLPRMAPFVESLAGARSRTAVLGTQYPKYSAAYSAAMQAILIGEKDAQTALDEAQATAEAGM
jgi:multiple sugar transport system substrate-binding protein